MKNLVSLAFFDEKAVRGWTRAQKYGKRVATMPDVVDARLASVDDWDKAPVWNSYVTTTSAEYAGVSKDGNRILIVAHGNGPLSEPKDIARCYKKRDDQTRGGITSEEFRKLESGAYGPIEIVDLEMLAARYQYPFIGAFPARMARTDALFKARVGPRWEEYLDALIRVDDEYEKMPEARSRSTEPWTPPPIIQLNGPSNSTYVINGLGREPHRYFDDYIPWTKDGGALAHLIVVSQVTAVHLSEYRRRAVAISEIGLHESSNGSRFVGMPKGCDANFRVVSGSRILQRHWRDLLVKTSGKPARLRHLVRFDDGSCFTDRIKTGEGMDHCVAEHPVRSMKKVRGPKVFTTTIGGYHGFLKYGLKEVADIAPDEANIYVLGHVAIRYEDGSPGYHDCEITFYKADIDLTRRVMTTEEIEEDASLVVQLT